jgi:enoyl-CoA hydratase/carnithine racemase
MEQIDQGTVRTERRGAVLEMVIDRPRKRNAFTPAMFEALGAAYSQLERDPTLRVGLVWAEGAHFSAGIDLPLMAEHRAAGRPYVPLNLIDPTGIRAPFRTKPVVFAMRGVCFTIAIELMLGADIVVAASDCRFAHMEVRRGVMPGCGGTYRLLERVGWGNAMHLLLTGDEFDAREAHRLGLVQRLTEPGEEVGAARTLCDRIADQAPQSVAAIMANCRAALGDAWTRAATEATAENNRLFLTEDAAEGRRAVAEKREPIFTGR